MKDYVMPCIREKKSGLRILHVGTNELNSRLTPERIAKLAKSIIMLLKTLNQ